MKIDLANILDRKCLLRKLEMAFQRIQISKFSGGSKPSPLTHPPKRLTPSALASFIDNLKFRFYILERLDGLPFTMFGQPGIELLNK